MWTCSLFLNNNEYFFLPQCKSPAQFSFPNFFYIIGGNISFCNIMQLISSEILPVVRLPFRSFSDSFQKTFRTKKLHSSQKFLVPWSLFPDSISSNPGPSKSLVAGASVFVLPTGMTSAVMSLSVVMMAAHGIWIIIQFSL